MVSGVRRRGRLPWLVARRAQHGDQRSPPRAGKEIPSNLCACQSKPRLLTHLSTNICPIPAEDVARRASCSALPSLLSLLVRPPGVPGIDAVGVNRPPAVLCKGVCDVDGAREAPGTDGEVGRAPGPSRESTRSFTSLLAVVRGYDSSMSTESGWKGLDPPRKHLSPLVRGEPCAHPVLVVAGRAWQSSPRIPLSVVQPCQSRE